MGNGICIFGGSFDPVHKGHKKLALFTVQKLNLKKMLIIPAALSPFKSNSGASSEDRLEMCRRAFTEDVFEVSDIEISRGGKSYTVETVSEVKKLYPDKKIYLLIGSDQLLSFDRWYKFDEILKSATLVSVSREDGTKKEELEIFAKEKLKSYGECLIFDFAPFEMSSTEIRRKISSGEDVSYFVDKDVVKFITEKGIYKNV